MQSNDPVSHHPVTLPSGLHVSTHRHDAGSRARYLFLYAPGAGSNLDDPFGKRCAEVLPANGVAVWRFQFPYMEARRRSPDQPAVLRETWKAVLDAAAGTGLPLVAGGRSMGGRIASEVVADGASVTAVALFAYPLYPPGKPEQRRTQHLPSVQVPALFCSGTRDAFGTPAELAEAVALVPHGRLHQLEGADHGFNVLKSSGRTREDVWQEAIESLLAFLEAA